MSEERFKLSYEIDYSPLLEFYALLDDKMQQHIAGAVETAGNHFVNEWIRTAESKFRYSQGGYARGIQEGTQYPYQGNPLEFKVVHTEKYATYLEYGADLKNMLQTSSKIRFNKKNERYLVIPFMHGNPHSIGKQPMSNTVYKLAKNLSPSHITGRYKEGSQQGANSYDESRVFIQSNKNKITRNKYKWGSRVTEQQMINAGIEDERERAKYIGMYRFEKNPNIVRRFFRALVNKPIGKFLTKFVNNTESTKRYGNYITFRIMKEGQTGWEIKPMYILRETIQNTESMVRQIISEGVRQAFQEIL